MKTATTMTAQSKIFNLNGRWVPVKTLDEARSLWCQYRDTADGADGGMFGASDMKRGCGDYRENGVVVARISYNGRMWAADGSEIK